MNEDVSASALDYLQVDQARLKRAIAALDGRSALALRDHIPEQNALNRAPVCNAAGGE